MNIEQFILLLEAEFDDVEKGTIQPGTVFMEMNEWCSLYALILIAVVSTEYGVELNGDDLLDVKTVSDLYELIQRKRGFVVT